MQRRAVDSHTPVTERRRHGTTVIVVAICLVVAACSDAPTAALNASARNPVDLSPEWTLTSPAAEHVDSAILNVAFDQASQLPWISSLLVVRHSHLVREQYFAAGGADSLYSVRSVTKSVMSLLTGVAIHQGRIASQAVTLSTYFRPPLPVLDAAKGAITIHDLLTMTSGFQWNEESNVAEYDNWVTSPDEIAFLIDRPLVCAPGQCWNYNSAAVHLLSVILSRAIPAGTAAYADSVLFKPLGIRTAGWEVFPDGYPNGGAGLYLRPRDMAKIGALILQRGWSASTPVVPADWVRQSTQKQLSTAPGEDLSPSGQFSYGDLWWVGRVGSHGLVLAWGYGGQYIWIVPDLDLVVVATAAWQGIGDAAFTNANASAVLIADQVMPAVLPD